MWSDTYVFTLDFQDGSGARDISALVMREGVQRRRGIWNKLEPTVNTLTFPLRFNSTIHNKLMTTTKDILVAVTKNSAAWFTGVVRPNFDIIETSRVGTTRVECVDRGLTLQKKIMTSISWTSYDVCKPSGTATSIVHQLMVAAGYSTSDVAATIPAIAKTLPNYVVVKGDETYWDALKALLFEFGYVFYFQADGKLNAFNFAPSSITPAATLDNSKMEGSLRLQRAQREYEGVRVKWWQTQTFQNVIVASDATNATGLYKCMIPLAVGAYYPTGSDTKDMFIEYSYGGYDLVAVVNAKLDLRCESGITLDTFSDELLRAKLKMHNSDSVPHNITRIDVVGDALCKTTLNWTESPSPLTSDKILEFDTSWITALADAQMLATAVQRYYSNVNFVYRAKSKTAYDPGTFLTLQETSWLSVSTTVVVTEAIDDLATESVSYTLEGMAAYSAAATTTSGVVEPTPPDTVTISVDGGLAATVSWTTGYDGGAVATSYDTKLIGGFPSAQTVAMDGLHVDGVISATSSVQVGAISADSLSATDASGRLVTVGGTAAVTIVDAGGSTIHDVPDSAMLANSFPMGHLYLHKFDNALYTLVDTSAPSLGSWTAVSIVTDGMSNIHGVRLKIYMQFAGGALAGPLASVCLRPYGSTWGTPFTDMTPNDFMELTTSTAVGNGGIRVAIMDVPVSSGQFEYNIDLSPNSTKILRIQQLGIWI